MKRLGALTLLLAFVSACVATPIPLPGDDDMWWSGARDGSTTDSMFADIPPPKGKKDLDLQHGDGGIGLSDAAADVAQDAVHDGACLECPQPDGMTDAGVGDAGATADALDDLQVGEPVVGDLLVGE